MPGLGGKRHDLIGPVVRLDLNVWPSNRRPQTTEVFESERLRRNDGIQHHLGYRVGSYTHGETDHKGAVTAAGAHDFTYDDAGNMVTRDVSGTVQTISYDESNRIESVTEAGETTEFVTDADGNRVARVGPDGMLVMIGDWYERYVDLSEPRLEFSPTAFSFSVEAGSWAGGELLITFRRARVAARFRQRDLGDGEPAHRGDHPRHRRIHLGRHQPRPWRV